MSIIDAMQLNPKVAKNVMITITQRNQNLVEPKNLLNFLSRSHFDASLCPPLQFLKMILKSPSDRINDLPDLDDIEYKALRLFSQIVGKRKEMPPTTVRSNNQVKGFLALTSGVLPVIDTAFAIKLLSDPECWSSSASWRRDAQGALALQAKVLRLLYLCPKGFHGEYSSLERDLWNVLPPLGRLRLFTLSWPRPKDMEGESACQGITSHHFIDSEFPDKTPSYKFFLEFLKRDQKNLRDLTIEFTRHIYTQMGDHKVNQGESQIAWSVCIGRKKIKDFMIGFCNWRTDSVNKAFQMTGLSPEDFPTFNDFHDFFYRP